MFPDFDDDELPPAPREMPPPIERPIWATSAVKVGNRSKRTIPPPEVLDTLARDAIRLYDDARNDKLPAATRREASDRQKRLLLQIPIAALQAEKSLPNLPAELCQFCAATLATLQANGVRIAVALTPEEMIGAKSPVERKRAAPKKKATLLPGGGGNGVSLGDGAGGPAAWTHHD